MNVRYFAASFTAMIRSARLSCTTFWAATALVACSGGASQPPTAFVRARLGGGQNAVKCDFGTPTPQLQIGDVTVSDGGPTSSTGQPVGTPDGSPAADGVLQVKCSVKSAGAGFAVGVRLLSTGSTAGGSLTLDGSVDTSTGGTGITAAMGFEGKSWSASNCTIRYTYNQAPIHGINGDPVAKGRIWGHLSCPGMMNTSGAMRIDMMGNAFTPECNGEIDFQFQNCDQ